MVLVTFFIGLVVGIAIAATFPKMTLALHERLKELSKKRLDDVEVSKALNKDK